MNLQKVGDRLGSNEGGRYVDTDKGNMFYVKHYKNADQAKVEALTSNIYNQMGIKTLNPEYREINGRPTIITPWKEDLRTLEPREYHQISPDQAKDLGRMYHAAVLTKNWDIVGLEHDNIMSDQDGNLHAIDHGGSFNFRAQGKPKPYSPDIEEHETLRDPSLPSGHVFNQAFAQHPEAETDSLDSVRSLDDKRLADTFKNSGLHNWKDLYANFIARKSAVLGHYGETMEESTISFKAGEQGILNGVVLESYDPPMLWENVEGQGSFKEPSISRSNHQKVTSSGVVILESHDKVWIVHPTDQYGGYSATFPKGTFEYGLNSRETAIKEAYEEAGLKVQLKEFLTDLKRTTSVTRYYLAERISGNPGDMDWESEKVSLVPIRELHKVVNHPSDRPLVEYLQKRYR